MSSEIFPGGSKLLNPNAQIGGGAVPARRPDQTGAARVFTPVDWETETEAQRAWKDDTPALEIVPHTALMRLDQSSEREIIPARPISNSLQAMPQLLDSIKGTIASSPDLHIIVSRLVSNQDGRPVKTAIPPLFADYADIVFGDRAVEQAFGKSGRLPTELDEARHKSVLTIIAQTVALAELQGNSEAQTMRQRALSLLSVLDRNLFISHVAFGPEGDDDYDSHDGPMPRSVRRRTQLHQQRQHMRVVSFLGGRESDDIPLEPETQGDIEVWLNDDTGRLIAEAYGIKDDVEAQLPTNPRNGDFMNALRNHGDQYYIISVISELRDSLEAAREGAPHDLTENLPDFMFGLDILRAELKMIQHKDKDSDASRMLLDMIDQVYPSVVELIGKPLARIPVGNRTGLLPASDQGHSVSETTQALLNAALPGSFKRDITESLLQTSDARLINATMDSVDPNAAHLDGEALIFTALSRFQAWSAGNKVSQGLVEVPVRQASEVITRMCLQFGITFDRDRHAHIIDAYLTNSRIGASQPGCVNMLDLHLATMGIAEDEGVLAAFDNNGANDPAIAAVVTAAMGDAIKNSDPRLSTPGSKPRGLNWVDITSVGDQSSRRDEDEAPIDLLTKLRTAKAQMAGNFPGNAEYARSLSNFGRALVLNAQVSRDTGIAEIDSRDQVKRTGQVGLILGGTGTGKTYALERLGEAYGVHTVVIDMSTLVPEGIRGKRISDALFEGFTRKANELGITLQEVCRLAEQGKILVMLDEARKFLIGISEQSGDGGGDFKAARDNLNAEFRRMLGDEDNHAAITETSGNIEKTHAIINTRGLHFVLASSLTGAPEEEIRLGEQARERIGIESKSTADLLADAGLPADTIGRIQDNTIITPDVTARAIRATWYERSDNSNPRVFIERGIKDVLTKSSAHAQVMITDDAAELFLGALSQVELKKLGWRHVNAVRDRVKAAIIHILEERPDFVEQIKSEGKLVIGRNRMAFALRSRS